jgi:hypothetical protein
MKRALSLALRRRRLLWPYQARSFRALGSSGKKMSGDVDLSADIALGNSTGGPQKKAVLPAVGV